MNTESCKDPNCDGLSLGGVCNQCNTIWGDKVDKSGDKIIRVCGLAITVKEVNLSGGHLGQASLQDSEILINKDLADDLKRGTMIHEVIHIISDANALDITEEQTSCLANNLAQFLMDNGGSV